PARGAARCEHLDRAAEAIEHVALAADLDRDGFVIRVTADFALHGDLLHRRDQHAACPDRGVVRAPGRGSGRADPLEMTREHVPMDGRRFRPSWPSEAQGIRAPMSRAAVLAILVLL